MQVFCKLVGVRKLEILRFRKLHVNFTIEGYDAIRIRIFAILIELLKILKEISLHGMIGGGETSCGSR